MIKSRMKYDPDKYKNEGKPGPGTRFITTLPRNQEHQVINSFENYSSLLAETLSGKSATILPDFAPSSVLPVSGPLRSRRADGPLGGQ